MNLKSGWTKGKEILIFQDVNMYTGETGNRVVINILKPGTDDEVDNYEYRGGWSKARPVQLPAVAKLSTIVYL